MQAKAAVTKAIGDGRDGRLELSAIEEHSATPMAGIDIDSIFTGFEHLSVALRALNGCMPKTKATATQQATKNTVAMAKALGCWNLLVFKTTATQDCVGGRLEFHKVEVITTASGVSTDVNVNAAFRLPDFGHRTVETPTVTTRTDDLLVLLAIRLLTTKASGLERLLRVHSMLTFCLGIEQPI